jgi:hypothetical protein
MIAEYRNKTNIGVGIGLVVSIVGRILMASGEPAVALLGLLVALAGTVVFIWGCWHYAMGKGYHGAWGLLGLLSFIGLIILVLFPDRHRAAM